MWLKKKKGSSRILGPAMAVQKRLWSLASSGINGELMLSLESDLILPKLSLEWTPGWCCAVVSVAHL